MDEDEEIAEELLELVKDGLVFASCPKCKIILDFEEIENTKCNSCGIIEADDILYQLAELQPSC